MVDIRVNKRGRVSQRPAIRLRPRPRAALWLVLASALLWALAASAAKTVPAKVMRALESDDVRVRIAAVVAVSKSGAENARAILEAKLKSDESPPVRAACVEGLARIGDPLALPAVKAALEDKAALVRKVAREAVVTLEAKIATSYKKPNEMPVPVDVSDVRDLSDAGIPGLDKALQKHLVENLLRDERRNWQVSTAPLKQGYGLLVKVRSITPFAQDDIEGLEVACDITVVKLPDKALRLSLTATAAAGVRGKLKESAKASVAMDGIQACAAALAKDFLDYAFQRPGP